MFYQKRGKAQKTSRRPKRSLRRTMQEQGRLAETEQVEEADDVS